MADASLRLLVMLKHIPREPKFIGASTLKERLADAGYEVSLRTVQRDLHSLSLTFPIMQMQPDERSRVGIGWCFMKDSRSASFPVMGSAAALSLTMVMQHLNQLLPAKALESLEPLKMEAEQLLASYSSGQYKNWFDKVRIAPHHLLLPPKAKAVAVDNIYQALLENKQFKATYNGKAEQVINPYGLVQQGHTLYLLCSFFEYEDIRITALHRFADVVILEDWVRPNATFDIDNYLGEGAMYWPTAERKIIALTLRIADSIVAILNETPLSYKQEIMADANNPQWSILKTEVLDSHQLRRWLLSQSFQIEIVEPVGLRNWMADTLSEMTKLYR